MRIDASGNVGIGTQTVTNSTGYNRTSINGSNGAIFEIKSSDAPVARFLATGGSAQLASLTAIPLLFNTNNSERMRLDASGNLLVGTTNTTHYATSTTSGHTLFANGTSAHSADGGTVGIFNRRTNDGIIAEFRKDGSAVGSISTRVNYLTIRSGDSGLLFNSGSDNIAPEGTSGARDAAIDLGTSATRFKNLYLSGGAYLGGTAAANKLDDYEEGTWTPEIADATSGGNTGTYTNNGCFYTKIGRAVYIHINISSISTTGMTGSNTFYIRNLPFTSKGGTNRYIGVAQVPNPTFTGEPILNNAGSSSYLRIMDSGTNADLTVSAMSGLIYGSIMYTAP